MEKLKKEYENARNVYVTSLSKKIDEEIKELQHYIFKLGEIDFKEMDALFGDFSIDLTVDTSVSDYYNYISFLTINNDGDFVVGSGAFDSDYSYQNYDSSLLSSDVCELEHTLSQINIEKKYVINRLNKKS